MKSIKTTEKKYPTKMMVIIAIVCSAVLLLTVTVVGLFRDFMANGFDFSLERRLTNDSNKCATGPGHEFDVEFPEKSASEANSIAESRIGRSFYTNAMSYAYSQTSVKDLVGSVTEIRPAKGENAFYPPFTDGDGGGVVTLRISGDKGVIVVSVRGGGTHCRYPSIKILAVKSLTDGAETQAPPLLQPIRLLDKETEAAYDQSKHADSLRTKAEQFEKAGKTEEAEKALKWRVAQSERELDSENLTAIRYQMAAEYKDHHCWFPPALLSALSDLAEFYQRQKQPETEREILRKLITVDAALCPEMISHKPDCLCKLAKSYENTGQLKEAVQCVAEELALYEKSPPPFRAYTKRRAQKYQDLLNELESKVSKESTQHKR